MKLNLIKSTVFASGRRWVPVLLASLCLVWVAFISGSAQLKGLKRVTSLQLGQAAGGARVSVISDGALNDYEAFRRGDRFYVKIPQAEFTFSQPSFRGDGFDDVQIQKVGDSVIVSFKLQPGASAHVEERSNRLEVIFNAPNRGQLSKATNNTPAIVNNSSASQNNQDRQRAAAGPAPSDTPQTSRARVVNVSRSENIEAPRQPVQRARTESSQGRSTVANKSSAQSSVLPAASPMPTQIYSATPSYTPATSSSTPYNSPGSKSSSVSGNSAKSWFSNRKGSLLAALVLAGALALVAGLLYRGRTKRPGVARDKRPLAQPKYEADAELKDLSELTVPQPERVSRVTQSNEAPLKTDWHRPVFASAAEAAAGRADVLPKPSVSSVVVADSSVSEEREVFEL